MTREDIIKKLKSGAVSGKSSLAMRSEAIQHKHSSARMPKLKKELRKKSKLLVVAELAVPFNPETGEEDEEFNAVNKYRPPMSATSVALYLKARAAENETTRDAFMRRAGISDWDLSDLENLTETDKQVFGKYRVPRIFTLPVCHVNIPKMTNNNFGRDYAVNVEYDEVGGIKGETPMILKVNKLLREICYEKIAKLDKEVKDGIQVLTEEQIKDRKRKYRSEIAVSDVVPSNWVEIVEVPLTSKFEISAEMELNNATADSVRPHAVIAKLNKGFADTLAEYARGDYSFADHYFDFYELDMTCPLDQGSNGQPVQIYVGSNTKMETPKIALINNANTGKLIEAIRDFIDGDTDIEATVRRSTYISDYTDDIADQIITSLHTVLDISDNEFLTQKVIKANQEVLSLAFGDDALQIIEETEAGVSDHNEGLLDEAAAKTEAKYDVNSMLEDNTFDDVDSVDIADMVS